MLDNYSRTYFVFVIFPMLVVKTANKILLCTQKLPTGANNSSCCKKNIYTITNTNNGRGIF